MGLLKKQHKATIKIQEQEAKEKKAKDKEFVAEYNELCEKYHRKIVCSPMVIGQIKVAELTEEEIKKAYEKPIQSSP